MSGLREKQKADRHDRILAAASALFRDHGYEQVKMEAIAAAAEVSIGTIYNYYQNKGDLLMAIVAMEVNEVLAAGEKVIARPPRSAERAIDTLIGNYIEHSLVYSEQGDVASGHGNLDAAARQSLRQDLCRPRPQAGRSDLPPAAEAQDAGRDPGRGGRRRPRANFSSTTRT